MLSLAEILQALEDPAIDYTAADIYICPPDNDDPHDNTDEDSGDEDCQDPDRVCRRQLQAEAEVQFEGVDNEEVMADLQVNEQCSEEISLEEEISVSTPSSVQVPSTSHVDTKTKSVLTSKKHNKRRNCSVNPAPKKKKRPIRNWEKGDLEFRREVACEMGPPVLTVTEESHPLDFFQCFMPEELVEDIVKFSVTYAVQKNTPNFELGIPDFYTFLGILYLTGYVPLPRRRMYWENSDDVHNTLVSNSMRRNRFDEILRFLHFCNNDEIKLGDKMAKIRPILDKLNLLFLHFSPAEQKVSVDESMIPYFGRHSCKQFIRGKPIRFGYKAWVLAARNGYCIQTDIYQGKKGIEIVTHDFGLGERVVLEFCKILADKYPNIRFSFYVDNFFTSPTLIAELGKMGMNGTGTVKANRTEKCPLPHKKAMTNRERGAFESFINKSDNIVAVTWKDNSVVTLLSNEHGVAPLGEAKRYSVQEKRKVSIPQPNLIAHYNRNMGGVDLMDNTVANYRIGVRGKRWYIPIVMWLFDVVMSNAWFLARSHGVSLDSLGFRRSVVQALLQKYGHLPKATGPTRTLKRASDPSRIDHGGHLIVSRQNRRRCAVCKNKTVKACKRCEVPLHDTCFAEFHKK